MSRSRKEVLADALKTEIGAASVELKTLFTDDVTGWSPYVTLSGLAASLTSPPSARQRSPTS